jgi:hypothetical protein
MGRTVVTVRDVLDPTTARELDARRQKLLDEVTPSGGGNSGAGIATGATRAEEQENTGGLRRLSVEEAEERRRKEHAIVEELLRLDEERAAHLPPGGVDSYVDRLLKYIPAESVALYLTLQGIILSGVGGQALTLWLWIIFVIGLCGTPLYLWRVLKVGKIVQLVVSTAAFGVWVFALGGAFASLSWYQPFIGSLVLVVFTFFAPLISPDTFTAEQA